MESKKMGLVMSLGTSAASGLASCCVGSAASCVCSGLKAIMPSGYTAAKVYALILFFGASLRLASMCRAAIVNRDAARLAGGQRASLMYAPRPRARRGVSAPSLPSRYTYTHTHTASVVTALILLSTEPKIDMDYFTVQCTGQYKDRYACGCSAPRTKPASHGCIINQ